MFRRGFLPASHTTNFKIAALLLAFVAYFFIDMKLNGCYFQRQVRLESLTVPLESAGINQNNSQGTKKIKINLIFIGIQLYFYSFFRAVIYFE